MEEPTLPRTAVKASEKMSLVVKRLRKGREEKAHGQRKGVHETAKDRLLQHDKGFELAS